MAQAKAARGGETAWKLATKGLLECAGGLVKFMGVPKVDGLPFLHDLVKDIHIIIPFQRLAL